MKRTIQVLLLTLATLFAFNSMKVSANSKFSERLQEKLSNAIVLHIGKTSAFVNNKECKVDSTNTNVTPIIKDGRTLVPVRFISENVGAKVEWNESLKAVEVRVGNNIAKFLIGSKKMYINDTEKEIDVPAQIINERTFIPLRAMVEALGKKVFWDDRGLIVISDKENILTEKDLKDEAVSLFDEPTFTLAKLTQKINLNKDITAIAKDDETLEVIYKLNENYRIVFNLKDNLLYTKLKDNNDLMGAFLASNVIDAVGQLYGYKKGESYYSTSTNSAANIQDDGWVISKEENSITIDVSKRPKFITDLSNVYFSTEIFLDSDASKFYLEENSSASLSKYGISMQKMSNGYVYIFYENNGLSGRTYKSILSLAYAIYGSEKGAEYFSANYPDFKDKLAIRFPGVIVECNTIDESILTEDEKYKYNDLKRRVDFGKPIVADGENANLGYVIVIFDKEILKSEIK